MINFMKDFIMDNWIRIIIWIMVVFLLFLFYCLDWKALFGFCLGMVIIVIIYKLAARYWNKFQ